MKHVKKTTTVLTKWFVLITIFTTNIAMILTGNVWAVDSTFACGGKVENEVWDLWDRNVKNYLLKSQLQDRLIKQDDVYALYDFQTYTHNLVSMARRCNRTNRLQEIARITEVAYSKLEPAVPASAGRRWVCRGGSICNEKNRLLHNEVILDSAQFLGVASSVANALATSGDRLGAEDKLFIRNTSQIVIEHLLRWSDRASLDAMQKARKATVQDVKDGAADLFFTDKPLWLISIYAELAGILDSDQQLGLPKISPNDKGRLSLHFQELLLFFNARLTIQRTQDRRLGITELADIDQGYWRLFATNAYAGYEKTDKPVLCVYSGNKRSEFRKVIAVPIDKVPKRKDIGWDVSHARRLVHALDALERNRLGMKRVFNLTDGQLPPVNLTNAFANTLVGLVWNGNKTAPLFSNYLNGANGWYRVAYDNRTGQCVEGTPPFGLTESFPTGGYVAWAKYNPTIGMIGKQLYHLINSTKPEDVAFIARYYEYFGISARAQYKSLRKIMFLPSLVGVSIK